MLIYFAIMILSLYNLVATEEAVQISAKQFDCIYGMVDNTDDLLTIDNGIVIYSRGEYSNFQIDMDILDNEGSGYGVLGYTDISSIDTEILFNNLRTQSSGAFYKYVGCCIMYFDQQMTKRNDYCFNGYSQ